MDFEALQQQWKTQRATDTHATLPSSELLNARLKQQQRKIIVSNIGTTIGFIAAFVAFAWVYWSFHNGRSWLFSGSIAAMYLLLIVYLFVIWKNVSVSKYTSQTPTVAYLNAMRTQFVWRRKVMTQYIKLYMILLWISLMCYGFDITQGATMQFKIGYISSVTGYMFLVYYLSNRFKAKKQLTNLNDLIAELDALSQSMQESGK
jgi:hypothetical protein